MDIVIESPLSDNKEKIYTTQYADRIIIYINGEPKYEIYSAWDDDDEKHCLVESDRIYVYEILGEGDPCWFGFIPGDRIDTGLNSRFATITRVKRRLPSGRHPQAGELSYDYKEDNGGEGTNDGKSFNLLTDPKVCKHEDIQKVYASSYLASEPQPYKLYCVKCGLENPAG